MRVVSLALVALLAGGCSLARDGLRPPAALDASARDGGARDGGAIDASARDAALDASPRDASLDAVSPIDTGTDAARDAGRDAGSCTPSVGRVELCNARDDDCDGTTDEGGACPCAMRADRGSTYLFCTPALQWMTARTYCTTLGYDLVVVNDAAEQAFVWGVARGASSLEWWLGLEDRTTNGTYVWVDGTTIWSAGAAVGGAYNAFRGGRPDDDASQGCMQFDRDASDGLWADHPCDAFFPFVCETR